MGILNKILFWRRDDEFDFDKIADKEAEGDIFKDQDLGLDRKPEGFDEKSPFEDMDDESLQGTTPHLQQPRSSFSARQPQKISTGMSESRELELISSKLDTVKALLTSMDQRISNLERAAGVVERKEKLW